MWRDGTWSFFRILDFRRFHDFLAEVPAQVCGSAQIDLPASEQIRQLQLHACDTKKSGDMIRLEFDQQVDVAIRTKIIPQGRAENRQPPDPVALAETGYSFLGNGHFGVRRSRPALCVWRDISVWHLRNLSFTPWVPVPDKFPDKEKSLKYLCDRNNYLRKQEKIHENLNRHFKYA